MMSSPGSGGPCGACKFLRRKCVAGCVFAPYFDSEQGAVHFAAVHKVFGASNVSKLLLHIPLHRRMEAVVTLCYEAQARLRDPVYGCVAHILSLHHQVVNLQAELAYLQAHLASLEISIPPPPQHMMAPPLSISDLPPASSSFDLSSLFDAPATPSPWPIQAQRHFAAASTSAAGADLHALARELLNRQGSSSLSHVPHTATDPTHSSSSSMAK